MNLPDHILENLRLEYSCLSRESYEAEWASLATNISELDGLQLAILLDWSHRNTHYWDSEMLDLLETAVKESCKRLAKCYCQQ